MRAQQTLVLCIICLVCCCEGQQSASNSTEISPKASKSPGSLGFPKCCGEREALVRGTNSCAKSNSTVNYEHYYFDSNGTHINNDKVKIVLTTFYQQLIFCQPGFVRVMFYHDEVLGFTYNASIVVASELILPDKYCLDEANGMVAFLMCVRNDQPLQAQVPLVYFLALLIISTLCCFSTALIYPYMMKLKEVHKKCFVGYSFSTGFAILFEIILQTEMAKGGCNILGSLFFFFTISSFVWLVCLCIDLIVRLRNLGGKNNESRFYMYIAASSAIPSVISLITLLANGNKPAVPDSFFRPSNGESVCQFPGGLALFFVPVGILVFASLSCLAYFFYLRTQNEKYHPNDHDWVKHKGKFNYMFSQCLTLFTIRLIFFVVELIQSFLDASLVETSPVTVLKVISSLEGFFILLVFVVHCFKKKQWQQQMRENGRSSNELRLMRNFLDY